jgi:PAS domain S-box-containing protein
MLSDAIFRALVESLPDSVVIANREGVIVLVNAQTEALFGYEREELIDRPVELLVPEEIREAHVAHRRQFARRPGTRPMGVGLDLVGQRKDGSRFPVEISLSPLVRGAEMYVTSVIRDVTERNRLRAEVETQQERQRIAMDLHDGTIQSIYAVGLGLELALGDIVGDPVAAGRRVDASIEQLNAVIADVRSYIFDLRPVQFAGELLPNIISTLEEFRASSTLEVVSELPRSVPPLREERAAAMLHIVREGLSNARKHARASRVSVTVIDVDGDVSMELRDDGDGFDAMANLPETHRGLRNMRRRAQQLGGVFEVESEPGSGTLLRVTMPAGA